MALTWATIWALLGGLLGVVYGILRPQDVGPGETPLAIALTLGIAGLISGAGFALMLSLLERGRSLRDVSLLRVALWGAVGGAIIPLLTTVADSQVFWTCPLGALLAATSVSIARRGERPAITDTPRPSALPATRPPISVPPTAGEAPK